MTAEIGSPAPAFELADQNREKFSSHSLRGNKSLVVFIPFAFSGVCGGELCEIRDRLNHLSDLDASVVVITTDSAFANKAWAEANGFEFPILADFWPHGATAQAFGCFNDKVGVANRFTYVLDEDGIVRDIVNSEAIPEAREFDRYLESLAAV